MTVETIDGQPVADWQPNSLRDETIGELFESVNPEFTPLLDGDSPSTPLPLRGPICGRNKFMGLTIPRMDRYTDGGILIPAKDQQRPNVCRVVKLSRDIVTWQQDRTDCFRELSEIRDMFPEEYNKGAVIMRGPTVTYLPGNCQAMPFHCSKNNLVGEWEWLLPFYDKQLLGGLGGLEFVSVYGGSMLNMLPYFEFQPVDFDEENTRAEQALKRRFFESAEPELLVPDKTIHVPGIMVKNGASPNRV